MQFNTLKSAKEYLRKQTPICLPKSCVIKDKNPKSFIRNFVLEYSRTHRTIYAKNGNTQCRRDAFRTASDIFRVTYYYFPKVKLYTVYNTLFSLIKEDAVNSNICSVIRKRVYYHNNYGSSYLDCYPTDELSINFRELKCFNGVDGGDWDDDSFLSRFKIPHVD